MQFNYRYFGNSSANSSTKNTNLSFAPDSLHDVVISDLRFQPKDRTEYLAWVKFL